MSGKANGRVNSEGKDFPDKPTDQASLSATSGKQMDGGQHLQTQSKIKVMNDERGHIFSINNSNKEEIKHDDANHNSNEEQVNVQSSGTWVTQELPTLDKNHQQGLDTDIVSKGSDPFQ